MKRVLVTGGSGQLGTALKLLIPQLEGIRLIIKCRKQLDITDLNRIRKVFSEEQFDYCINAAAYTAVEEAENQPQLAYAVNTSGARNLARVCGETKTSLIHISTDYVFDGEKGSAYSTTDRPNPINIYGKSKLEGEIAIQEEMKEYIIVRTSWLYSERGQNFYTTILSKARRGEELHVTDSQIGCPTHVDNLAKYLISLISAEERGPSILHYTDEIAMSWYDFAVSILQKEGLRDSVELKKSENYRTFAARPRNSTLK